MLQIIKTAITKPLVALLAFFLKTILRICFRFRVLGKLPDTLPEKLLFVCNHESFLDGLIIGLAVGLRLPQKPMFVINTQIASDWKMRVLLCLADYVTVDPANPMAMKTIIRLLDDKRPVVIFPEGRITTTGSLMKIYEGPAFVAHKTQASIIPLYLHGASLTKLSRLGNPHPVQWFPRLTLTILPAVPPSQLNEKHLGESLRKIMQTAAFEATCSIQSQTSIFQALCDSMAIYGRGHRILEDIKQTVYRYSDVMKMVLMLGRLLEKISQPGERIGVMLPNTAPSFGVLVGLMARSRTPAMFNYTAGVAAWRSACVAANIKTLVTSRAFIEQAELTQKLEQFVSQSSIQVVYLEDLRTQVSLTDKLWYVSMMFRPRAFEIQHNGRNDSNDREAVVLFTSGSEGTPKGVVLSHRAILANVAQIRSVIHFSVQDKMLNALPMFHSFGLTAGTLLPLLSGMPLFLYPSPLHYRVIPEIAYDRDCSVILGTSTFLGNYAKYAHPYDFYRIRYAVAGAEKLSESVRDIWFEKFGVRILEGYGATETAPVLAVNTPMAYRTGTVGQLLPGVEYRCEPVEGIDQGGLLHVKAPNVMSGYLKDDKPNVLQHTQSSIGQGWYETGDVVSFDEEGYVRIVGRVKRFVKIAGEMVSLEAVEKLARHASADQQHGAISQADPSRGEAIVLFTTDSSLTREALQASARALGIPELAVPRQIKVIAQLPLMGTGKTDYVALKAMLGG
jgi:acyl-[acyl-carrier-protein]-phospholipid O-acyltransferase/long-chain-fatty-acid--[acyl-carrier-protein] ligase